MGHEERQAVIDQTAFMARDMMDELTTKVLWDILFQLINPDEPTMNRLLTAIAKVAIDQIREDMFDSDEEVDAEDMEFCSDLTDEAIKKAFDGFKKSRAKSILTDDFANEVIKSLSINVARVVHQVDKASRGE
jgi:hypothetical protein